MITGEPVPVHKAVGGMVVGGTLNQNGAFTLEATELCRDHRISSASFYK